MRTQRLLGLSGLLIVVSLTSTSEADEPTWVTVWLKEADAVGSFVEHVTKQFPSTMTRVHLGEPRRAAPDGTSAEVRGVPLEMQVTSRSLPFVAAQPEISGVGVEANGLLDVACPGERLRDAYIIFNPRKGGTTATAKQVIQMRGVKLLWDGPRMMHLSISGARLLDVLHGARVYLQVECETHVRYAECKPPFVGGKYVVHVEQGANSYDAKATEVIMHALGLPSSVTSLTAAKLKTLQSDPRITGIEEVCQDVGKLRYTDCFGKVDVYSVYGTGGSAGLAAFAERIRKELNVEASVHDQHVDVKHISQGELSALVERTDVEDVSAECPPTGKLY